MELNRAELLRFFDEKPAEARNENGQTFGSGVSALTGLIGEELVLDLLFHYWKQRQSQHGCLRKLVSPCCAAKGRRRLDAWVVRNENGRNLELIQVEVKNWTYHSVNMKRCLRVDASLPDVVEVAHRNWAACIEANKEEPKLSKVMQEMRSPQEDCASLMPRRRLLCIWAPVLPPALDSLEPLFEFQCAGHPLDGLWVFSASLYLRSLTDQKVDVPLTGVAHRLRLLRTLGVVPDYAPR